MSAPAWKCPSCGKGALHLVPKSLEAKETPESLKAHDHEAWDPGWIEYVFSCWLRCSNNSCKGEVAVTGVGYQEPELDPEDGSMVFVPQYYPRFVSPMPDIIELPDKCPDVVTRELRAAFRLFFVDAGASAGRVRVALERLMDHLGVQRRKKGSKGRFYDLSLHQRIEIYANATPDLKDQLLAIKWLGNTGSHEGQIVRDDMLSGFEVLEHVLVEVVDRRAAKVKQLAKQLTKKHAGNRRRR